MERNLKRQKKNTTIGEEGGKKVLRSLGNRFFESRTCSKPVPEKIQLGRVKPKVKLNLSTCSLEIRHF